MKLVKTTAIVLLIFANFFVSYWWRTSEDKTPGIEGDTQKIVTMAPSSGEVVFALGLGDQLVGVSRFAKYPPEVESIPKVGGYLDVDIEAVVRMNPDVVVLLKEQSELAEQLEALGMSCLLVDHMSVEGILSSISSIGKKFGKEAEARILCASLESRINVVSEGAETKPHKRVLLSIGRDFGAGKVKGLVAAGAGGFHQELLKIAGYENAYVGDENFPQLSREHLIKMNPEVIIDMVNQRDADAYGREKIKRDWAAYHELSAVQQGNVFLLVGDAHFVPGPRFVSTLEWFAHCEEGGGNE